MRNLTEVLQRTVFSCCVFLAGVLAAGDALAVVPSGFKSIAKVGGVQVYKRSTARGAQYVQVITLTRGSSVKLLSGPVVDGGVGQGVYGGDNPTFTKQSLSAAWEGFQQTAAYAFSLVNGQFFDTNSSPTRLTFPVKIDVKVVSDGYGLGEFPNNKLILEIWGSRADIRRLSKGSLYGSSAPNIIAGLDEFASKGRNTSTGRTFAGVKDVDGDGDFETIMIFTAKAATQIEAAKALKDFRCAKVIMFDGGGSTQMVLKGSTYLSSTRKVPQTIGVVSANNSLLRIDGGTSSRKEQGETFAVTGSNLPPNKTVKRWALFNGALSSLGDLTADAQGRIQWEWTPNCGNATGTYKLWLELQGGLKSNTIDEIVEPSASCTPAIVWEASRAVAFSSALSQGRRVLLLAGRDSCANTTYMRFTVCEATSPPVKQLLLDSYVPWYSDVDDSTEWYPYASGLGAFTLPLICVIDPAQPGGCVDRSTGLLYPQAFHDWLAAAAGP